MSWLDRLTLLVNRRLGIRLSLEGREDTFRRAVDVRAAALGLKSPEDYVDRVSRSEGSDEFQSLVLLVTNGHTSFFRDLEQLMTLRQMLSQAPSAHKLRIWCAGCSTGEEAYTLAMICDGLGFAADILGTDINHASLTLARRATYDPWAARRVPQEYRRFFVESGEQLSVIDGIRSKVRFEQHNLLHTPPRPAAGHAWDVIFCRNVFIYFPMEEVGRVATRFASVLAPTGHLFLGASERLPEMRDWVIQPQGKRHIYRPRNTASLTDARPISVEPSPLAPVNPSLPDVPAPAAPQPRRIDSVPDPFAQVTEHLDRKHDDLAMDSVRAFLETHPGHVAGLLTLGNLELAKHRFDEALAAFTAAADTNPFLPDVYLFQGITHRKLGNLETARLALQRALFLAPEFWPASFMLIGIYGRMGRSKELSRELRRTLDVLNGGDGSRLLAPGVHGGFYPDANEVREACLVHTDLE